MILSKKPRLQFLVFLITFFIINVLQSVFTSLFEDEAYYWLWSKQLAFGYFDHPPLVAVWIKISDLFFNNELGVRFFSTISFSLMLTIIWMLIDIKEKWNFVWLYFLLITSIVLIQVFGFIATPDVPLLLFVSLFLLAYKGFIKKESISSIFFLSVTMAGLLYSKYHGVLVIFFVVLSNLKLLKNKNFLKAVLVAFILFIPHLYWQFVHDFPSVEYHLKERSKKPYTIQNTLMFVADNLFMVGITFPAIYWAFFSHRIKNLFEKALVFIVYGFFVFFFISSFYSSTQAQWMVIALIPLIIIVFPYFIINIQARKLLITLGLIQFVLLLIVRLFLANEHLSPIKLEPHLVRKWVFPLKQKTENKPIVFVNSYRNASVYQFYTGIQTHSYSVVKGRKSQFDLNRFENKMQGKDVFVVGRLLEKEPKLVLHNNHFLKGKPINNYNTFEKVKCIIGENIKISKNDTVVFKFKFVNTYNKNINFEHVKFIGVFQGAKNKILNKVPLKIKNLTPLNAYEEKILSATFTTPDINFEGKVTFRVALEFYDMLEGFQGNKVKVN